MKRGVRLEVVVHPKTNQVHRVETIVFRSLELRVQNWELKMEALLG